MAREKKRKADRNVWVYDEDFDLVAKEVSYGEKFADALHKILQRLEQK